MKIFKSIVLFEYLGLKKKEGRVSLSILFLIFGLRKTRDYSKYTTTGEYPDSDNYRNYRECAEFLEEGL